MAMYAACSNLHITLWNLWQCFFPMAGLWPLVICTCLGALLGLGPPHLVEFHLVVGAHSCLLKAGANPWHHGTSAMPKCGHTPAWISHPLDPLGQIPWTMTTETGCLPSVCWGQTLSATWPQS